MVCGFFVHKLLFSKLKKKNRNIITLKTEYSLISFYRTLRLNEVNIAYKCDHNHPSLLNQWKHIGDDGWMLSVWVSVIHCEFNHGCIIVDRSDSTISLIKSSDFEGA